MCQVLPGEHTEWSQSDVYGKREGFNPTGVDSGGLSPRPDEAEGGSSCPFLPMDV